MERLAINLSQKLSSIAGIRVYDCKPIQLVIASLVNLFFRSSALDFTISLIGIAIFTILTAIDTQKLKSLYYTMNGNSIRASNIAVYGALTLYLDFINLFIMLLHFLGNKKED